MIFKALNVVDILYSLSFINILHSLSAIDIPRFSCSFFVRSSLVCGVCLSRCSVPRLMRCVGAWVWGFVLSGSLGASMLSGVLLGGRVRGFGFLGLWVFGVFGGRFGRGCFFETLNIFLFGGVSFSIAQVAVWGFCFSDGSRLAKILLR